MSFIILIVAVAVMYKWDGLQAYPDSRNPNSDYELVDVNKPTIISDKAIVMTLTTPRSIVIRTPPPVDPNSKTFTYNPQTKVWILIKNNDPKPADDTLLWNQSNDKWLTQIAS